MDFTNFIPFVYQYFYYGNKYSSLFNVLIITTSALLKLLFYTNYYINLIFNISILNSILHYFIDTISIIKKNGLNDIFVVHHIFSIYIFLNEYIFMYNNYVSYVLLFMIELSSISYNLYVLNFLSKKIHIFIYIPLRTVSNLTLIYFLLYEMIYSYNIEYVLNIISYFLLFMFNIGGIFKSLKFI